MSKLLCFFVNLTNKRMDYLSHKTRTIMFIQQQTQANDDSSLTRISKITKALFLLIIIFRHVGIIIFTVKQLILIIRHNIIKIIIKPQPKRLKKNNSTSRRYTEEGANMAQKKITWSTVKCTAERPTEGAELIITRAKAKQLLEILTTEYKSFSIASAIKKELECGSHDTHIGFYVDGNDIEGYEALQNACMQLVFNHINYYYPSTEVR